MAGLEGEEAGAVLERIESEVEEPRLFNVLLHNDDYTTMEFVVEILETVFGKTPEEAARLMMAVHTRGVAVCGSYAYEIAETKVEHVHDLARQRSFPLRASVEEA